MHTDGKSFEDSLPTQDLLQKLKSELSTHPFEMIRAGLGLGYSLHASDSHPLHTAASELKRLFFSTVLMRIHHALQNHESIQRPLSQQLNQTKRVHENSKSANGPYR